MLELFSLRFERTQSGPFFLFRELAGRLDFRDFIRAIRTLEIA
jgi:hypothetical protein